MCVCVCVCVCVCARETTSLLLKRYDSSNTLFYLYIQETALMSPLEVFSCLETPIFSPHHRPCSKLYNIYQQ